MKVYIDEDEYYPYRFMREPEPTDPYVEIDDKTYRRLNRLLRQFKTLQDELQELEDKQYNARTD